MAFLPAVAALADAAASAGRFASRMRALAVAFLCRAAFLAAGMAA